eukprot:2425081-Amphidinium_carterae.1
MTRIAVRNIKEVATLCKTPCTVTLQSLCAACQLFIACEAKLARLLAFREAAEASKCASRQACLCGGELGGAVWQCSVEGSTWCLET